MRKTILLALEDYKQDLYATVLSAIIDSTPRAIGSGEFTYDNTGGTTDYVSPLASGSCRAVVLKVVDGSAFIGGANQQIFPVSAGDVLVIPVNDLSSIYVRVPAGSLVTIDFLYVA